MKALGVRFCGMFLGLVFAGCGEIATRDPGRLAAMVGDTAVAVDVREDADRLLGKVDERRRLEALEGVVGNGADSQEMRGYAVGVLFREDEGRFVEVMRRELPTMEGEVLAEACGMIGRRGKGDLLGVLVESLARENGSILERPEVGAIEAVTGKRLSEALWMVISQRGDRRVRIGALDVVQNVEARERVMGRIVTLMSDDMWLGDVRWWVENFGSVPVGKNESEWIHEVRNGGFFPRVTPGAPPLLPARSHTESPLYPRFTPSVFLTDVETLGLSRSRLFERVEARLKALKHVRREPSSPGARDDNPETLAANDGKLSFFDLVNIDLLMHGLEDAGTRAEILRQGLADRADTTTEHGGMLTYRAPGALVLTEVAPMYAGGDGEYVTSDAALAGVPTHVALYHFHFHRVDNAEIAGPGVGDLKFAAAMRVSCVVFTSLAGDAFDVDYYNPEGAVVDLGIYQAPK